MTQQTWDYRPPAEAAEWLPTLDIPEPQPQRRLTVLVRWLLLIPQFIVLVFLGIAAFFAVVFGWFAALFIARLPEPVAGFLSRVLAYETRVHASALLLVDAYPRSRSARCRTTRCRSRCGRDGSTAWRCSSASS